MALRSSEEFRESLRDGRRVVYRGALVDDVTKHPALGRTIDHAARLFELPEQGPEGFWSFHDDGLGETVSTFFLRPTTPELLHRRGDVIEEATRRSGTTLNIVKVVGTDALLALETVTARVDAEQGTEYAARVSAFRDHCARGDLAMALAATDNKGDRSKGPSAQADPDQYLHVVARDADGITVRGAKVHTTASPSANELIVIPCRAMGPDDSDYAVAFAVPMNVPGLTLISHPMDPGPSAEAPVSRRSVEIESLTVFDDVKVPWERVFLCGEASYAGQVATAFANFHRYTAVSYKPPAIDLLIGAAALVADQLGIASAGHVRDKVAEMICYVELIRGARIAAATRSRTVAPGLAYPDPLLTNAGKHHFSTRYHGVVAALQDLAGGLVVTAPGIEDLEHPEYGPLVEKYLVGRAGVSGRERWDLVQLVRDMTASEFGGYNDVVTLHGEGSPQAQRIAAAREFDLQGCLDLVRQQLRD